MTSRRIMGLLLCGTFLVPMALHMALSAASGDERPTDPGIGPHTIELLPYQAAGYRYHILTLDETPPPGFEQPSFDDTGWNTGAAAFGSVGDCPLQGTVQTPWPAESQLLIRRVVAVPPGATGLRVLVTVDNDIMGAFFNGVPIAGFVAHEDCPIPDEFRVDVPPSLVTPGDNLVAVQVRDRHPSSFFDTRLLAEASTLSGRIQTLRINEGTSPARVSIRLNGTTACPTSGWFAYENAATGLGLVQTQGLLAAYQSGQQVTIVGTETCDAFGVEEILYIDLQ